MEKEELFIELVTDNTLLKIETRSNNLISQVKISHLLK